MGTRSVFMVTGCGEHQTGNRTIRLYRHWDGDPRESLRVLVEATEKAEGLGFGWNSKPWREGDPPVTLADMNAETFADCIIAASLCWSRGFEAWYDDAEGQQAIFPKGISNEMFGNQGDLEWVYVVHVHKRSIDVYGGDYGCPEEHLARGRVEPADAHAAQLKDEYQTAARAAVNAHLDRLLDFGWNVNGKLDPAKRKRDRKPRPAGLDAVA
jgi:hypothetical protein